jgi:hypothetical protein
MEGPAKGNCEAGQREPDRDEMTLEPESMSLEPENMSLEPENIPSHPLRGIKVRGARPRPPMRPIEFMAQIAPLAGRDGTWNVYERISRSRCA